MAEKTISVRKKITEHLFDFIMLFAAITLGFFADNFRDAYEENQQAKELAADAINDIAGDTIIIHRMKNQNAIRLQKLDSLYYFIDDDKVYYNNPKIYYYSSWVYTGLNMWYENNNNTYLQMTNSGSLSYLRKPAIAALTDYEQANQKVLEMIEIQRAVLNDKIYPFLQQVFHTENFHCMLNEHRFVQDTDMLHWNADTRWVYHNYVSEVIIRINNLDTQYDHLLDKARSAIAVLKREYKL